VQLLLVAALAMLRKPSFCRSSFILQLSASCACPPLLLLYCQIMSSPAKPMHIARSKENALHSVIVDWLLLSTCDFSVIAQSGFSKTATAYSIKNPYRLLLPIRWDSGLFKQEDVMKCQGAKPSTLLDFRWWSGL